ncbi:MAG: SDR family oxidoreductase, partial [Pseudomonadota bacterium]
TQSMARVLAPAIRVNAVAPGYVGTGWFEKRMGAEAKAGLDAHIAGSVPMGLAAMAEDISGHVVHLLDPVSRAITGEVLRVDAGAHLDVGLSRRPGKG